MLNDIIEDAIFEVRRRWKTRVLIPVAIIAVFMLVGVIITTVGWFSSNQARPPAVNSEDIPLGSYAAGNIEVFDCIYRGPEECSEYKKSREWVSGAVTDSFVYSPIEEDESAPGEQAGGGTRRVSDFQSLSDEEWHALAAGVTREGQANPGTVTENTVETSGLNHEQVTASATFTLTEGEPTTGTMVFTLTNSGVVLKSVTYTEGA